MTWNRNLKGMFIRLLPAGVPLFLALATACSTTKAPVPAPAPAASPAAPSPGGAAQQQQPADIAGRTRGFEKRDGLVPLYIDQKGGKVYLEIPRDSMRVLFFAQLATGLGSNPIGLDRGGGGTERVTQFVRAGERVLVVFENWNYRTSLAGNASHAFSVAQSFPPSTIAALPVVTEEGERLLVDATDFVFRDWNEIALTMQGNNEGTYTLSRDRSTIYLPFTKAFPDNSELDVALTFAASGRGGSVAGNILGDARAFTLHQHLSFVRLPDDGYRPRAVDPRIGFFGLSFKDYAQPFQARLEQYWISRFRLQRTNLRDANSPIRNPIVYYVDPGIPEPLRSATVQGARFWEQAFDRAGLRGGFVVRDLPPGADPMDIRYNMVLWINRNERGWSFGGSLGDPRTGENIKGVAHMDSHRNRTAYNIYAALMGADPSPADTHFVLGRVRQVTAHEIGHTLGMAHNYIASTYERGSVMDYPAPRIRLDARGEIDVSQAYALGPGEYDVWAVRWAYGIFPPESEADSLRAIAADGLRRGYLFLSDGDARPEFSSDPRTNLWDDAGTAFEFLKHQMDVRRAAMRRFGERNIRPGEPLSLLHERFVPLYLFHRFGVSAVARAVGGMEYHNAIRGDGQQATRPVDVARQRQALAMLIDALSPGELAIPDTILTLFSPVPSFSPEVELFQTRARPAFDELGTVRTLAQMIVDALLQRDRAARLVQFARYQQNPLTLSELVDRLAAATLVRSEPTDAKEAGILRATQRAVADRMLLLAADKEASPDVRAMADYKIRGWLALAKQRASSGNLEHRAHWTSLHAAFTRWLEKGELPAATLALRAPPGDPFGEDDDYNIW